jgi:hypothetical protein
LVGEGLDAGVLERVEQSPDRADIVDSPLLVRVRVLRIVWRLAIILAKGVIARFDEPENGVERLALIVPVSHRIRPPYRRP